jgi:hypothetical protein
MPEPSPTPPAPEPPAPADRAADIATDQTEDRAAHLAAVARLPPERGGRAGPEPTRYGDWESKGRCTDF